MVAPTSFQTKTLKLAKDSLEYNLYKAALEWDLIDPIMIENRTDLKSEHTWQGLVDPYHHQVTNLITFCRRLPVTLLADDVGLGKTISAGLIMSELITRERISNILIVCPKILMEQWKEELDQKFKIPTKLVIGCDLINTKPHENAGAIITTYQSARSQFEAIANIGFDMLVLDEAHKLRNLYNGAKGPPKVAIQFQKALTDRLFKYVLMLTATPIQNRLWDIYSLIDLLTVARGHENPFGTPGMFSRKFIADDPEKARRLAPEMQEEFRAIVYRYMSRVRRTDVELDFPERKVQLHKVTPTPEEIMLIKIISENIQKLDRRTQINIFQAAVSSPHAIAKQFQNMAAKGTIQEALSNEVKNIANSIRVTAKLQGLGALIEKLKSENPDQWRAVIFTGRRETQTSIQEFLKGMGVTCGLINGDTTSRNQDTISVFIKDPQKMHVIISTEAGSEGVNLQAANVLVNYDLPWNPMIVEQRIGRIQRLASKHATVCIVNIVLQNTFEEYIVGRLMEKLQMVSSAVGETEALLQVAGFDSENDSESFEEQIRKLIIASLEGKNQDQASLVIKSIEEAKNELKREEDNMNKLLGGMSDSDDAPVCPNLPPVERSMNAKNLVISALENSGATILKDEAGKYWQENNGEKKLILLEGDDETGTISSIVYKPGHTPFNKLIDQIISNGLHQVTDLDHELLGKVNEIAKQWVASFDGKFVSCNIKNVKRIFNGTALIRVTAIVAHDKYERLIEVPCYQNDGNSNALINGSNPLPSMLKNPNELGVSQDMLIKMAHQDKFITEFCKFYLDRLSVEIQSTGDNKIKRKKLEDDLTPQLEVNLVGLHGNLYRELESIIYYQVNSSDTYTSTLTITPYNNEITYKPIFSECDVTKINAPSDCLDKCNISSRIALKHLLIQSEVSSRKALTEHTAFCALSGKRVLIDEITKSDITGKLIASTLLKTSKLSNLRGEPEYFEKCEFTSSEVLTTELATSQISSKKYRIDEKMTSVVSGKSGHQQEFIHCAETKQPLLPTEAETCECTGRAVIPGILESCEISMKKVLPSELERSSSSGKKALKRYFITSSISGARLLEMEALRSVTGKFCAPLEAKVCFWSGQPFHPDDLRVCQLSGLLMHFNFINTTAKPRSLILVALLDNICHKSDCSDKWDIISSKIAKCLNIKRCRIIAAELSPDKSNLAICLEIKTWLGLKTQYTGLFYSLSNNVIVGKIVTGKRTNQGWVQEN